MLKLFQKLQTSDFITRLENKDGRFVVQDSMSMALIAYSLFIKKPQKILINCPNLYQAQDVYEHLINLLGDDVVDIICPKHGEFKQIPKDHLNGHGCLKCQHEKLAKEQTLTLDEFIKRAKEIHGAEKYDYSEVNYINYQTKVIIICRKHKEPYKFSQTPHNHLNGVGCPKCRASKGEITISNFLIKNKIEFEEEKWFKNCRNKFPLPFDFYLPQYNLCIEYDGQQHFIPIDFSFKMTEKQKLENFKQLKTRDKIKTDYCKSNNINLLRIRYDENIEEKLSEYFQNHEIIKETKMFDLN